MDLPPPNLSDAEWISQMRDLLPTSLGSADLRDKIAAGIRARGVFVARGTNSIYLTIVKQVVDELAGGRIGESDARVTLLETLKALGYTPEGGFPDDPPGKVPPAVRGSLQDLSSFRRLELIVRTQVDLMAGAGMQHRGHQPDELEAAPAWELVRIESRMVPREWRSRFKIAGGAPVDGGRMIALKGDPVWGELGSSGNFDDALDVDYPPFAFNSGMGWREISRAEAKALNITGPEGESIEEFHASRPQTLRGQLALPSPSLSLRDVDPALLDEFREATQATAKPGKLGVFDYSTLLDEELEDAAKSYQRQNPNYRPTR